MESKNTSPSRSLATSAIPHLSVKRNKRAGKALAKVILGFEVLSDPASRTIYIVVSNSSVEGHRVKLFGRRASQGTCLKTFGVETLASRETPERGV